MHRKRVCKAIANMARTQSPWHILAFWIHGKRGKTERTEERKVYCKDWVPLNIYIETKLIVWRALLVAQTTTAYLATPPSSYPFPSTYSNRPLKKQGGAHEPESTHVLGNKRTLVGHSCGTLSWETPSAKSAPHVWSDFATFGAQKHIAMDATMGSWPYY